MTGGRLLRVKNYVKNESFCFTYGDGVANINLNSLIKAHKKSAKLATLTAVQPPGRFGSLSFERGRVLEFNEKPKGDKSWINGGFFVCEKKALDFIKFKASFIAILYIHVYKVLFSLKFSIFK